jgi:hypothetical protein
MAMRKRIACGGHCAISSNDFKRLEEFTMSKWVQVRDSLLDAIKAEEVGKELKNNFVGWAEKEGIEFIETFADGVVDECQKDAATETGWCKIRDAFVLPMAINGGVFVLKIVLTKAAAGAEKKGGDASVLQPEQE